MLEIPGVSAPYAKGKRRIEQVRYSWEKLTEDTGVHTEELGLRAADFGLHYWTSHHPFVVPEPLTLESPHARVAKQGFWAGFMPMPNGYMAPGRTWVPEGMLQDDRGALVKQHPRKFRRPNAVDRA